MHEKLKHWEYFDNLEIENRNQGAPYTYDLFKNGAKDVFSKQLALLSSLDSGFKLVNARSFQNQVHFQGASKIPVQRWFPYREGYSTSLVKAFLELLHIRGNVFDPFCGSGTTLLAARLNDLNSFGIDVNPVSCIVASVENAFYTTADIHKIAEFLNDLDFLEKSSKTYLTPFDLADKVFNEEILQALLQLKELINSVPHKKIRDVLFVGWLAIIEQVSNIKKEGNGIKYKNRRRTPRGYIEIDKSEWESLNFPEDKFSFVIDNYQRHMQTVLSDLKNNYGSINAIPTVFLGDCLKFNQYFNSEIAFTFFSPPYCNCFDYFEIHKVELWLGDFVKNKDELKMLRNSGFRSNTNSILKKPIRYHHPILEKIIKLFDPEKLWNKKIPSVVRGYFDDMHQFLEKLFVQTSPNGYVGIVVGNSAYSGVIVPTDVLIADIARRLGFRVDKIFVTRHLTTSSQQKLHLKSLNHYLRESIVLLGK